MHKIQCMRGKGREFEKMHLGIRSSIKHTTSYTINPIKDYLFRQSSFLALTWSLSSFSSFFSCGTFFIYWNSWLVVIHTLISGLAETVILYSFFLPTYQTGEKVLLHHRKWVLYAYLLTVPLVTNFYLHIDEGISICGLLGWWTPCCCIS